MFRTSVLETGVRNSSSTVIKRLRALGPGKQATGWSSRNTGPENGALLEELVVAHVMRSVTGKGQANHAVEDINGGHTQIDIRIDHAQCLHPVQYRGYLSAWYRGIDWVWT